MPRTRHFSWRPRDDNEGATAHEHPPEFQRFARRFVDLSPDDSWPIEESIEFAFGGVQTHREKLELKAFLDQLLDGTHSDEELTRLWIDCGARIAFSTNYTATFLRDVRTRLSEKIARGE